MNKKCVYNKVDVKKNEKLGLHESVMEILTKRGIEDIENFVNPNITQFHSSLLMKDMEKGIKMIIEALINDDKIVIYGDYDCDGIGGTAVGLLALRNLHAKVDYYINNRFTEGYGICEQGVDKILEKHPDLKLIITVDNGIKGHDVIEKLMKRGIKVIVTDHHETWDTLPNADAVITPQRSDCDYPFKGLCGAGVIFKVMLELYTKLKRDKNYVYSLLDIVTLSTIGDVVPILDENRVIVKEGLKLIQKGERPVFRILQKETDVREINSHYTLPFIYIPMINAVSRMDGDVSLAVDLFLEEDEQKIIDIVRKLTKINDERKQETEHQIKLAKDLIQNSNDDNKAIVIYHDEFTEGIIGIIAGRIKEDYSKPCICFAKTEDGRLKASGRSFDNFPLKDVLDEEEFQDVLLTYGGHKKACGLSINEANFDRFKELIYKRANSMMEDFVENIEIDTVINAFELNIDLIKQFEALEPFGEGFPKPLVGIKNFFGNKSQYIGADKQHVKLSNSSLSVLIFNEAEKFKQLSEPLKIKAVGYPCINEFRGRVSAQLTVHKDLFYKAN